MYQPGAVELVHSWHEAVNARDVDGALALCAVDVAVRGPRGEDRGHEVMRRWLERSGISLVPQEELVDRDGRVVVHELALWRPSGEAPAHVPIQAPAETWVVFEVAEGRLASIARYETAEEIPAGRSG